VVRAAADGYTIILGNLGTHVVNGAIYPLQYDLAKDFEPISLLPSNHQLLIANKATPEKDLRELIARLKANPDKVTIGNAGQGAHRTSPQSISRPLSARASSLCPIAARRRCCRT
jgi:tripartite-type tricarboxylate transporter receptor subunit TctC